VASSPSYDATIDRARVERIRPSLALLMGLALGAAVGVATSFAQAGLSGNWAALANAASPWLVAPLIAGALPASRKWAITAGLLACAMEVAGYYIATPLRGFPINESEIVFWLACAVFGGPAFGWAGWASRRGTVRERPVGAAMLPAAFFGEAIGAYAIRLHYRGDAILFGVIGLLLLGGFLVALRPRFAILGWTLAFTIAATVLFGPVLDASASFAFGA
jgi:hypothetical protein